MLFRSFERVAGAVTAGTKTWIKLKRYKENAIKAEAEARSRTRANLDIPKEMDKQFYEEDCLRDSRYSYNNKGSLFPTNFNECNINILDTFLQLQTYASGEQGPDGFQPKQLTGITDSMMYYGTYGSSFPWHTEDADLPSVNYMHQGKPKIWFVIPACELFLNFSNVNMYLMITFDNKHDNYTEVNLNFFFKIHLT